MRSSLARSSAVFALVSAFPAVARAELIEIGPSDDLVATVGTLLPGDELVLAGGTYNLTERFSINVSGEQGTPIVIRAKDGEVPIITRPDAGENTVNIEDATQADLAEGEVVIVQPDGAGGFILGERISAEAWATFPTPP